MTLEQKAKAYDEAMKQAIEIYDASNEDGKLALEMIFPELAESEDEKNERIRLGLIEVLKTVPSGIFEDRGKITLDEGFYWLERKEYEKKGKQKQWKPSEEQILAINTAINVIGKGTLSGKHLIEILEQLKAL